MSEEALFFCSRIILFKLLKHRCVYFRKVLEQWIHLYFSQVFIFGYPYPHYILYLTLPPPTYLTPFTPFTPCHLHNICTLFLYLKDPLPRPLTVFLTSTGTPITYIQWGKDSTDTWERTCICVSMGLDYLIWNVYFQFHPLACKFHNFIFLNS